jgi:nucleoside-diphosphate-sugar epimerase
MATYFVTGGSGFVGRNLIRALVARGDTVRALARSPQSQAAVAALGAVPVAGDLASVPLESLRGCNVVIHAAAEVAEWGPRARFHEVNVEGTRRLLASTRSAGVPRFVHIGTEAAYANGQPLANLDETRAIPRDPLPRYPETKAEAERLVLAANSHSLHTIVVRPRLIWGDDDTSVLPSLVELVKQGRFMWVNGGTYLTSTCHVRNVVEGTLLAAERGRGGEAYFLSDGKPVVFREFMTRMLATRGVTPPDKNVPRWVALTFATVSEWLWDTFSLSGMPPATRMAIQLGGGEVTVSDAKARRELGYQGKVSVEQGLAALEATYAR